MFMCLPVSGHSEAAVEENPGNSSNVSMSSTTSSQAAASGVTERAVQSNTSPTVTVTLIAGQLYWILESSCCLLCFIPTETSQSSQVMPV